MVRVVSDEDYEFLNKCKASKGYLEDTVQVVGPQEDLSELAVEISELRKESLDVDFIKNSLEINPSQESHHEAQMLSETIKTIATDSNLKRKDMGVTLVLGLKIIFSKLYQISYLMITEINDIFNSISDEDLNKLENLYRDVELYFDQITIFFKVYDNFLSLSNKNSQMALTQSRLVEDNAKSVINVVCKILTDLKEYDPSIVERELYQRYYTKEFCPEIFESLEKQERTKGLFASIKEKFKNFVTVIKTTKLSIQQAWKKTVSHPLMKITSLLMKRYTIIYISYIVIFNIPTGFVSDLIGGNLGFIDICIVLSTSLCRSFSDPFILGSFIKYFLSFLLASIPIVNFSSKIRDITGIVVGNAVTYLGPIMLYSWMKNVLSFILSVCCSSYGIAANFGVQVYRSTNQVAQKLIDRFYVALEHNPGDPLATMKEWTSDIGSDGAEVISNLFFTMFGPIGKSFTEWITNPLTSTLSMVGRKLTSWITFSPEGDVLKIEDKTIPEIVSVITEKSLEEDQLRTSIYSNIQRGVTECLTKGVDVVSVYLSSVIQSIMENKYISHCIDKFKALYELSYYYLQWIRFVKFSVVESSEVLFFTSDRQMIQELTKVNQELNKNINFLKIKDLSRKRLGEAEKKFKKRFVEEYNPISPTIEEIEFGSPLEIEEVPQEIQEEPTKKLKMIEPKKEIEVETKYPEIDIEETEEGDVDIETEEELPKEIEIEELVKK